MVIVVTHAMDQQHTDSSSHNHTSLRAPRPVSDDGGPRFNASYFLEQCWAFALVVQQLLREWQPLAPAAIGW